MSMTTPIIVVTGASKGIGAEIARTEGKLGNRVVMLARDMDALNQIADEINASGGDAYPFRVDLTDASDMQFTVSKIIHEIGVPDVLINNAGAGRWTTLQETPVKEIIQNIQVPGISTMVITKLFLEKMIEKATPESPVHIINMTSPAGLGMNIPGTSGGYLTARTMVANFTEALRIDLRHLADRVKISLISPGKVSTGYFVTNGDNAQENRVPLRSLISEITPQEVAMKVSETIEERESVNLVFPFAIKALVTAFKVSPTIMQFFLTHVFGWQPAKVPGASNHTYKKLATIAAACLFAVLIIRMQNSMKLTR